jgi:hypothetical protein
MLPSAIIYFGLVLIASPGMDEMYPCFRYGLFEVGDSESHRVLNGIVDKFEGDGWDCRGKEDTSLRISCKRSDESLETVAICETANDYVFRYYYVIRNINAGNSRDVVGDVNVGEYRLPRPLGDVFNIKPQN